MSKEEAVKSHYTFRANDLNLASKHILEFHVFVPSGVTIDDVLNPSSWTHIAQKLQPMSHIFVTAEDNTFCALLRVVSCGQLWAKTAVIWHKDLTKNATPALKDGRVLEVKYVSNRYKWGVQRVSDGEWVSKDHMTEAEAQQVMANELLLMQAG